MKIRSDFVTNSSSSSFVIIYKKENNEVDVNTQNLYEKFFNIIMKKFHSSTITVKEDLFDDDKTYEFEEYENEKELLEQGKDYQIDNYKEYCELIEDGYAIGKFYVEYGNEDIVISILNIGKEVGIIKSFECD